MADRRPPAGGGRDTGGALLVCRSWAYNAEYDEMYCLQENHVEPVINCSSCGTEFSVSADAAGDVAICPECGTAQTPSAESHRSAPNTLDVGGVVAERYEIRQVLGAGGMGTVYRAWDRRLEREVALKSIRFDAGLPPKSTDELAQRLVREARAAARLNHPNIVTVYDVGDENGWPYISMELLDGSPLSDVIEHGPIPLARTISIFLPLLSALGYAHSEGIIHRDLKPANVMLLKDDSAKLMDFGIAKLSGAATMTREGQISGTPAFLAPERIKGETVDGRSDVFSMGCILFELLTGQRMFQGDNPSTVIYKILEGDAVPLRQANPELPLGLDDVLANSVDPNPDHRYQTPSEFSGALGAFLSGSGLTTAAWSGPGAGTTRLEIDELDSGRNASQSQPHWETVEPLEFDLDKMVEEAGLQKKSSPFRQVRLVLLLLGACVMLWGAVQLAQYREQDDSLSNLPDGVMVARVQSDSSWSERSSSIEGRELAEDEDTVLSGEPPHLAGRTKSSAETGARPEESTGPNGVSSSPRPPSATAGSTVDRQAPHGPPPAPPGARKGAPDEPGLASPETINEIKTLLADVRRAVEAKEGRRARSELARLPHVLEPELFPHLIDPLLDIAELAMQNRDPRLTQTIASKVLEIQDSNRRARVLYRRATVMIGVRSRQEDR